MQNTHRIHHIEPELLAVQMARRQCNPTKTSALRLTQKFKRPLTHSQSALGNSSAYKIMQIPKRWFACNKRFSYKIQCKHARRTKDLKKSHDRTGRRQMTFVLG